MAVGDGDIQHPQAYSVYWVLRGTTTSLQAITAGTTSSHASFQLGHLWQNQ